MLRADPIQSGRLAETQQSRVFEEVHAEEMIDHRGLARGTRGGGQGGMRTVGPVGAADELERVLHREAHHAERLDPPEHVAIRLRRLPATQPPNILRSARAEQQLVARVMCVVGTGSEAVACIQRLQWLCRCQSPHL